jgi:hypothetical protein
VLVDRLVVVELPRVATAGDVVRSAELCSDLARGVAVSSKTAVGTSVASTGSGVVVIPTSGWLPLSVGETNPSNPGRAMCVVSVKAIAAPRMTEIVTTTRPSHSRTVARRPVSSVNTGLVKDMARQSPVTAPVRTRGAGHAN